MSIDEAVSAKREEVPYLAAKHGACNVCIFGSRVRGDAGPDAAVDRLVDMPPGRSLPDIGKLAMDLRDLLGCRVEDAVEPEGLHWYVRDRGLKEAVPL